jgi:hypothetical protein
VEKQEAKDIRCLYGTLRLNIYEDMLLKLAMSPLPRRKCQYIYRPMLAYCGVVGFVCFSKKGEGGLI